ncbi:TPA: coproporphyrinogen III oxidase [Candidatus Latescibacteria bacterium]|nr:coproporphyrinogen III oxidase [Candidatus Latescibacterota bacterium]
MPGLYVHIPFCASACPYCDFAFVVGRDAQADRYRSAVITELDARASDIEGPLDTVYFGGGTPSTVPPTQLSDIIRLAEEAVGFSDDVEITVEANPNDYEHFSALHDLGVNRLSLGIQSIHLSTLVALGRSHTPDDARRSVQIARDAGFTNLNVDAIFGGPKQTVEQWEADLQELIALEPDHVSIYGLTIEPRTPFERQRAAGTLAVADEDEQAAMYDIALSLTSTAGLDQYEISNYAKPGMESRHNLACWRGDTYLGVGMSAHSYEGHARAWNVRNMNRYLERIETGESPEEGREVITDETRNLEQLMLGLRTRDGVDRAVFRVADTAYRLLSQNLIETHGDRLRLTRSGKPLADLVSEQLARDL